MQTSVVVRQCASRWCRRRGRCFTRQSLDAHSPTNTLLRGAHPFAPTSLAHAIECEIQVLFHVAWIVGAETGLSLVIRAYRARAAAMKLERTERCCTAACVIAGLHVVGARPAAL